MNEKCGHQKTLHIEGPQGIVENRVTCSRTPHVAGRHSNRVFTWAQEICGDSAGTADQHSTAPNHTS